MPIRGTQVFKPQVYSIRIVFDVGERPFEFVFRGLPPPAAAAEAAAAVEFFVLVGVNSNRSKQSGFGVEAGGGRGAPPAAAALISRGGV